MADCNNCNTQAFDYVVKAPTEQPSCADMLATYVDAYNRLNLGIAEVEVAYRDRKVVYNKADMQQLLATIQNLHRQCPSQLSAALLPKRSFRQPVYGSCYGCR